MTTEKTPARRDWNSSEGSAAVFLLLMVVIVSDMPEPIPFWPMAWGQAPSVGTVLLIVAVVLAINRFGDRFSPRKDAAQ